MKVSDVMGTRAVAVRPEAPFTEIVEAMRRFKVGALTVIDADEHPIGVVSDDDLLLKETDSTSAGGAFDSPRRREEHHKAAGVTAREMMTSPAITVTKDTAVRDAARLMHRYRIKQLPVIESATGRLVGTVQQSDLLKVFTRPVEEIDREITEICNHLYVDREHLTVDVEAGVVTLTGHVGFRSQISRLVAAVHGIDGVLDVENRLAYRSDDLTPTLPLP
ncbi:CBS domain-containing protein [Streptosporangium minutum]|uniref:Signal transduction protein n=1 Tax=Streptosporangium minutum TaxID=569862 RepID=A0A243RYF8_9ACTN|nr:CBS domain-containing protein [Streptosporangium minutum]OUD00020.1 signal transduction protein [Streptosporangium minutum]